MGTRETPAEGPLVTVVVPAYDRPEFLADTLASVRGQTYSNIEILVRDDAGDPRNAEVASRDRDPRVRYHRNRHNAGLLANFVAGVRASRGKYIAKVDDDDLWSPELVATLVGPMEADESVVAAFCDHWVVDSEGRRDLDASERCSRRYGRHHLAAGRHQPFVREAAIHQIIPINICTLIRRTAFDVDDLAPAVANHYDLWLAYLLARGDRAVYFHPERLASYRLHSGQMTAYAVRANAEAALYLTRRLREDPELASSRELRRSEASAWRRLGLFALREGDQRRARRLLLASLRTERSVKAAAGLLLTGMPAHRLLASLVGPPVV